MSKKKLSKLLALYLPDVYKRQADFHVRPRPLHGQQLPKGNRTWKSACHRYGRGA